MSSSRDQLISVLTTSGFIYQEFIISPTQLRVPNSRNRYYLLAKKGPFQFDEQTGIRNNLPLLTNESILKLVNKFSGATCFKVQTILDETVGPLVPDKVLEKYAEILDIVTEDSERSCCFTKGYSHYAEGTGSVFCPCSEQEITSVYKQIENMEKQSPEYLKAVKSLGLRYFSPREVARLMCFPEYFRFPDNVSIKQKYRLLGNSVNVHVVAVLIKILTL